MTVPFHRFDKDGQQRLQPLPTDPIRRLPQQYERIAFRFIINTRPRSPTCRLSPVAPQQPHRLLAVETRDDDEFIQNSRLLRSRRSTITLRNRRRQFFPRRHAQLSHSRPCPSPR